MILLSVASVLGIEFQLDALKYISPLNKTSHDAKRIDEAIRLLEQNDFLEIVDISDQKRKLCRFNKNFLCESLY